MIMVSPRYLEHGFRMMREGIPKSIYPKGMRMSMGSNFLASTSVLPSSTSTFPSSLGQNNSCLPQVFDHIIYSVTYPNMQLLVF